MTDYLSLLNILDENERLEAKRGTEIGRSILETVCAFANEPGLQGRTLLLGVARPDALSADLATQCRERFNVPVRVQIATERRLRDAGLLEQRGRGSGTYYVPTRRLLGNEDDPALSSNPGGLSSNLQLAGLPDNLRELVSSLGQRAPPARMQEAIIALCRHRPWQAAELATQLNRTPDYVATRHLRPRVSAGVLAYTMPDVPNHPHQAYRAVNGTGETA